MGREIVDDVVVHEGEDLDTLTSQLGNSIHDRWVGAEQLFKFLCDMWIKGVCQEEMGGCVIGALERLIDLCDFFERARKSVWVTRKHGTGGICKIFTRTRNGEFDELCEDGGENGEYESNNDENSSPF